MRIQAKIILRRVVIKKSFKECLVMGKALKLMSVPRSGGMEQHQNLYSFNSLMDSRTVLSMLSWQKT